MSQASYSFLPYLRQGIANDIVSTGDARATFTVKLKALGDALSQDIDDKVIEIYGPGDVIGIDPRQVIKTDPHPWITNFESNYFAYIDFYDEDFPWRYSPVPAAGQRLNPWIALIVLEEGEFIEGPPPANRPLPYVTLKDKATRAFFPKTDQLWAWAHVHVNGDITASDATILTDDATGVGAALDKLQTAVDANSDQANSRLLCPRKLRPGVSYHALVIPAYESGRQAGTGGGIADIANAKLTIAWDDSVTSLDLPYYYRWKFNTGTIGDFEYLVRLLAPRVADSRIGRRVMDMTNPGADLTWQEDPDHPLGGILRLGGALKVPAEALTDEENAKVQKFDNWATGHLPALHPFQVEVAGLLNLADDYNADSAVNANAKFDGLPPTDPNVDEDPLITPPIYGRWHAMIERVYEDSSGNRIDYNYNWVNELNLDPRFRVPAHFGTRVVQENQEDLMNSAWDQIGDVLAGNRQIRFAQFALAASSALYAKHFNTPAASGAAGTPTATVAAGASKLMMLTAPLQKRILLADGTTVFATLKRSVLPTTLLSSPMRKIVRPRGKFAVRLTQGLPAGQTLRLETLVTRVSTGELKPSPPKVTPPALPTVDSIATEIDPPIPAWLINWLRNYPWLPYLPLVLGILIALLVFLLGAAGIGLAGGLAIAGGLIALSIALMNWAKQLKTDDVLLPGNQTPASVDTWPKSTDFQLTAPDTAFSPTTGGATDNAAAALFKRSVKDMYVLLTVVNNDNPQPPPLLAITLSTVSQAVLTNLLPSKTIPARIWQYIFIPDWIKQQQSDDGLVEAMAYPKINTPMYQPLKKISDELFLPNVELLQENSLTLLETNHPFIESYMVGLNHEFARELLWREFPTDQRGSYFRQFWDVSSILKDPALASLSDDQQHEPYYDITRLDKWLRTSKLGEHDNRVTPGQPFNEDVVLVIRGELLKKYPTTVVYAHKAAWTKDDKTGIVDVHQPRSLDQPEQGDLPNPSRDVIRSPLYQAKIDPDIYFFGFDLTVAEAKGEDEPANPTPDNAGWFFVLKERPGEARFGFEIPMTDGSSLDLHTWDDLDWSRILKPAEGVVDVLNLPAPLALPAGFHNPGSDSASTEENLQYADDIQIKWDNSIDAANLAYILYREPMMVCVHASKMLLQKQS